MHTIHGRFWSNSYKPGLFLQSQNRAVGCPWAAYSANIGSTLWNRIPWLFLASYTQKHNLLHKLHHRLPKQSVYFPKRAPKFPQFGPKFWDRSNGHSRPQINLSIYKTLKQRVNQVGENLYLTEFVETPRNRYPSVALAA